MNHDPLAYMNAQLDPITYVNGQFVPAKLATISPLDRGFIFGDGVYEVIPVFNGRLFHLEAHIQRLNQSLKGIKMEPPHTFDEWQAILTKLVQKNHSGDQWLYLQVTRGQELMRNHELPKNIPPTVFAISYSKNRVPKETLAQGIKVTTVTDIRWKFCNIKTISRLAYVLMFQEAKEQGFDEAIIMNNGYAYECTISNIFIVRHGVIYTPPKSSLLLSGITRDIILGLAEKHNIPYRESKIAERDLLKADEIWITSSIRGILPVVMVDNQPIGQGKAGPLWSKVWDYYAEEIAEFSMQVSH